MKEPEIRLDRRHSGPPKGAPLYVQIERRIEDLLLQGRYKAGDRIPPETALVAALGVSRVTVRAGLARLVERGLLERPGGAGRFWCGLREEPGCSLGWKGSSPIPFTPSGWG